MRVVLCAVGATRVLLSSFVTFTNTVLIRNGLLWRRVTRTSGSCLVYRLNVLSPMLKLKSCVTAVKNVVLYEFLNRVMWWCTVLAPLPRCLVISVSSYECPPTVLSGSIVLW